MSIGGGALWMLPVSMTPMLYEGRPVMHWNTGRKGKVVRWNPEHCDGSGHMLIQFEDGRTRSGLEWRRIGAFVLLEELHGVAAAL